MAAGARLLALKAIIQYRQRSWLILPDELLARDCGDRFLNESSLDVAA